MTRQLNALKKKGYFASDVLLILLYLPFPGISTVWGLFKSGCVKLTDAQKDVYYRLKNNDNIRWCIEVFFKEAKQYLKLGKSQANDFDAQIADVTISMMQYIILTLHKRFQAYETLGELFRQNQKYFLELTLAERLWGLFLELQRQIIEIFEIDIEEVIERMFTRPDYESKMLKILLVLASRNTIVKKIE